MSVTMEPAEIIERMQAIRLHPAELAKRAALSRMTVRRFLRWRVPIRPLTHRAIEHALIEAEREMLDYLASLHREAA